MNCSNVDNATALAAWQAPGFWVSHDVLIYKHVVPALT